jgi:molecular chaperone DnaJ
MGVGAEDGMVFRMPGKGDAPISGKGRTGDLLVRVNVANSKVFRRQGPNLYHEARIPFHTALLGGRVRIPTLDGDVEVRIPSGTQQGEEMVLKKRGVASRVAGHVDQGDLFVSFRVQLPRYVCSDTNTSYAHTANHRSLTDRQRAILQQYADDVEGRSPTTEMPKDPTPKPSAKSDQASESAKVSSDDNGTASFTPPPSQAEGGWGSRLKDRIRRLIGL